jgi:hypothetical protein
VTLARERRNIENYRTDNYRPANYCLREAASVAMKTGDIANVAVP